MAQIAIKKCASIESDSVLESSSAAKLVSMKLCVSSLIFEEGNVTTDKYHMVTYFVKTLPAAPIIQPETRKDVIMNRLDISYNPGYKD